MSENAKLSWAQRSKEALDNVTAEEMVPVTKGGGNLSITTFYRTTAPRDGVLKPGSAMLTEGQQIEGTYKGSFTTKNYGTKIHKIQTDANTAVGLPGSGQLNAALEKVEEGAKVVIQYNGKSPMKTGKFAGTEAHNYSVMASRLKNGKASE